MECKKELDEALPILEAANNAVSKIDKVNILIM